MNWFNIKGFENLYSINQKGEIFSHRRNRILNPAITKHGYRQVMLTNRIERKMFKIHRLVALHFIPNPDKYPILNHIDGNKLNNDISNLEWCTYSQNAFHAYRLGLKNPHHLKPGLNKRVVCFKEGKRKTFKSIKEAVEKLNISKTSIGNALTGRSKSAGGYIWKYA